MQSKSLRVTSCRSGRIDDTTRVEAEGDMEAVFDNRDEDINADCGPDLSFHCVLGGAVQGFDTQVLFNPFEEQFDPTTINKNITCYDNPEYINDEQIFYSKQSPQRYISAKCFWFFRHFCGFVLSCKAYFDRRVCHAQRRIVPAVAGSDDTLGC